MPYDDNSSYPGGGAVGSLLRGYQLYNLIQSTKQSQSDREYEKIRRQQEQTNFANSQADRTRHQQIENTSMQIKLNDEGARPTNPKLESVLNAAIGPIANPRMRVDLPTGSFYLPTHDEQKQQGLKDLLAKLQIEAAGGKYKYDIETPSVVSRQTQITAAEAKAKRDAEPQIKLAPELVNFFGKDTATKEEIQSYVNQHNATKPDLHIVVRDDDKGNVTAVGIDKTTMKPVTSIPLGQIGKSKTPPADKKGEAFKELAKFEEARRKIFSLYNTAKIHDATVAAGGDKAAQAKVDAQVARDQAQQQFETVSRMATNLTQAYPDLIEAGQGEGGWPYAKMKPSGASSTPQAVTATASNAPPTVNGQKIIYADQLTDYAKQHGYKDSDITTSRGVTRHVTAEENATTDLYNQGYTIMQRAAKAPSAASPQANAAPLPYGGIYPKKSLDALARRRGKSVAAMRAELEAAGYKIQ